MAANNLLGPACCDEDDCIIFEIPDFSNVIGNNEYKRWYGNTLWPPGHPPPPPPYTGLWDRTVLVYDPPPIVPRNFTRYYTLTETLDGLKAVLIPGPKVPPESGDPNLFIPAQDQPQSPSYWVYMDGGFVGVNGNQAPSKLNTIGRIVGDTIEEGAAIFVKSVWGEIPQPFTEYWRYWVITHNEILLVEARHRTTANHTNTFVVIAGPFPYTPADEMVEIRTDSWSEEYDTWIGGSFQLCESLSVNGQLIHQLEHEPRSYSTSFDYSYHGIVSPFDFVDINNSELSYQFTQPSKVSFWGHYENHTRKHDCAASFKCPNDGGCNPLQYCVECDRNPGFTETGFLENGVPVTMCGDGPVITMTDNGETITVTQFYESVLTTLGTFDCPFTGCLEFSLDDRSRLKLGPTCICT